MPNNSFRSTSVFSASLWMVGITLFLFFLPLINGLIGGFVGGFKLGSVKWALLAAILPAFVAGAGLWLLLFAFKLPLIGMVAGFAVSTLIVLADVGIFIGAVVGAMAARSKSSTL